MNDLTCSMRYPGQNITDLRKHAVNLVMFPKLHWLQFSHGPYFQFDKKYVPPTMVDIKESLFGESAFMTNMNPNHGKWLSSRIIFILKKFKTILFKDFIVKKLKKLE